MPGALDSRMDILLQLSTSYIRTVLQRKLEDLDPMCITTSVDGINVRDIMTEIESVAVASAGPEMRSTTLSVVIHAIYGWVQDPSVSNDWISIDEVEALLPQRTRYTAVFDVRPFSEVGRIRLRLEPQQVPAVVPDGLRDSLSDNVFIPLTWLEQKQVFEDPGGNERDLLLLRIEPAEVYLKATDETTLTIGIIATLLQDENPRVLGPHVDLSADPVIANDADLVSHRCGLPAQTVLSEQDLLFFWMEFADSFLNGADWGCAFDAKILDAILRGLPSASLNAVGEARDGCPHRGARRSMCLRLTGLGDGSLRIRGTGQSYWCPPPVLFWKSNDYYDAFFDADLSLELDAGLRATYTVTYVESGGKDITEEAASNMPMEGSLNIRGLRTRFGNTDSDMGRLAATEVEVRETALVLRGTATFRIRSPNLSVPERVILAVDCDGEGPPYVRSFRIENTGNAPINICPPVIRNLPDNDPDAEFSNAAVFRLASPRQLREGGSGRRLLATRELELRVELDAPAGDRYVALLEIPTHAGIYSIRLIGDLRAAELTLEPASLDVVRTDYARPCTEDYPRIRPVRASVHVSNVGPGNLQICSIAFTRNPLLDPAVPESGAVFMPGPNGYPRFLASGESDEIAVLFVTDEAHIGLEYSGSMRIRTSSGDYDVELRGRLDRSAEEMFPALTGRFDEGMFCGDANWDRAQDSDGELLDPGAFGDIMPVLGGAECCPPPRGPACRCVDLWAASFDALPENIEFEFRSSGGQTLMRHTSRTSRDVLIAPFEPAGSYSLRVRLPQPVQTGRRSRIGIWRWLLQQDGVYASGMLADVAAKEDVGYAATGHGIEIMDLRDPREPKQTGNIASGARVASLAVSGDLLFAAGEDLQVYSLAQPARPRRVPLKRSLPGMTILAASCAAPVVYAFGQRLHVLDMSDPRKPREVGGGDLGVRAVRAYLENRRLYVFGKEGFQIFDVPAGAHPRSVALIRAPHEVRNGFVTCRSAVLLYGDDAAGVVDISQPAEAYLAAEWQIEPWLRPYVPLAGSVTRYAGGFLMIQGDSLGVRLLRLRRNRVNRTGPEQPAARRDEPA